MEKQLSYKQQTGGSIPSIPISMFIKRGAWVMQKKAVNCYSIERRWGEWIYLRRLGTERIIKISMKTFNNLFLEVPKIL